MRLTVPAGAPTWVQSVFRDIERYFVSTSPTTPVRLPRFAVADLPDPAQFPDATVIVTGSGLHISNGVAWINVIDGSNL